MRSLDSFSSLYLLVITEIYNSLTASAAAFKNFPTVSEGFGE